MGWGGGWGGRGGGWGGWNSWGGAYQFTAGVGQPTLPAPFVPDTLPAVHTQWAVMDQAVAAPIGDVATSSVAPTPKEVRSIASWERGFGDTTPAAQDSSGTNEATAAIFGAAAPASQFQLDIPATVMGQATDTIRADSPSSESDDGAVMVDGQPQLAPEKAEQSTPAATSIQSHTGRAPGDSAATSAVELSGSTIAALVFAWQLRVDSAAAEKERRGVRRVN